jgi:hypothetical protein
MATAANYKTIDTERTYWTVFANLRTKSTPQQRWISRRSLVNTGNTREKFTNRNCGFLAPFKPTLCVEL